MESITLNLTKEQSVLVKELLEKTLEELDTLCSNTNSSETEIKRAQFNSKCVILLLQAPQHGYTVIEMPANLMKAALAQLKTRLENQMAIMMDLMQDPSLVQENQAQVIMRGIELLSVMHCMTHEALQIKKEAA